MNSQETQLISHKSASESYATDSHVSTVVNGTAGEMHSPVDDAALNGNDSDCDSGQQWTQVNRSSNGRMSNRRRIKQVNQRDSYQTNGHQGFVPRVRSFRGTKEHGFSFRAPPTDVAKNRSSFHEQNASGPHQNLAKTDRNSVVGTKLSMSVSVDVNGSGTHSPTGSSPSPSVSSPDPHNGGEYRDNRWSYRPQGRPMRGRRAFQMMPDTNYHAENSGSNNQQNLHNDHSSTRGSFSRPVRSPTSPVNSYHSATDEHWRRPVGGGNWRRPYNPRNTVAYNRFNGPASHPVRQYNNQPRYRASVPSNVFAIPPQPISSPPPEPQSDAESAAAAGPALSKPEPPVATEKRTSWAAAVAASPRIDSNGNLSQSCTDPSRAELLEFLLSQWRCFSAANSS
ncbi:unnamed protein product [Echinostoma caproni]|uniref:BAT2_N domain-containing protein n=1 Tax=Echinostoma caproni TaxID=27848 RepID=A0A183ATG5_9TREM|nr:unnamed protein product [Echinostoma caproni]